MDFGGSDEGESRSPAKQAAINDEDLLLDNFYKKAGQTSALGADLTISMLPPQPALVTMPPPPTTLPKQSENQQEYIHTHFKQK